MHHAFASHLSELAPKFRALTAMEPVRFDSLPCTVPVRGIYLFSEGPAHLYVGRTNGMRKRLQNHCRLGGTHFTATFAFRIARKESGFLKATYRTEGSRSTLASDPVFGPAFAKAKERVNAMDIRYVEESEPVRQALLELYAAIALETPYNDFDNH